MEFIELMDSMERLEQLVNKADKWNQPEIKNFLNYLK